MKQNHLFTILKGLSCLFVLLYFYPFFALANGFFAPESNAAIPVLETVSLLLPGGIGMALGYGMAKTTFGAVKKNILKILLLFPVISVAFFIYFSFTIIWMALIAAVLSAAAYFIGYVLAYLPYSQIINGQRFLILMGVYAGGLLLAYLMNLPYSVPAFVALFFIAAAIYLIQSNQSNIDFLMERRRHPLSQLPEKIRRYNLLLTGGIFIALLLLFLLKDWFILFFGWVGELLRRGIVFLFSLLKGNPFEDVPPETSTAPTGGEDMVMPEGEENPIVSAILSIAAAALFIFLIYHYRKELLSLFRNFYHHIRDTVSRLLHRERVMVRVDNSSEYYTDLEETLLPAEYQEPRRRNASGMRKWRKDFKQYAAMQNGTEKFRRGYALILEWLALREIPIRPSDTTLEILDKSADVIPTQKLEPSTGMYNALRYGEQEIPLERLSQVDAVLSYLRGKNEPIG